MGQSPGVLGHRLLADGLCRLLLNKKTEMFEMITKVLHVKETRLSIIEEKSNDR